MNHRLLLSAAATLCLAAVLAIGITWSSWTGSARGSFQTTVGIFERTPTPTSTSSPTETATPTVARPTTTATVTVTPTGAVTATPTATPTPVRCGSHGDASLEFDPDQMARKGPGPFAATIRIKNEGRSAVELDVLIGLQTSDGARYLQSVDFVNGQVWLINGQSGGTLYSVGTIPAYATSAIPITVEMMPTWQSARSDATAKIRVKLTSRGCRNDSSDSSLTIVLSRQ